MRLNEGPVKKPKRRKVPRGAAPIERQSKSRPILGPFAANDKTPGKGNRGGRGASGRLASRTDTSRAARDARRISRPTVSGGSGGKKPTSGKNGGGSGSKTLRRRRPKTPVKTPKPPTPSPPKVNPAPLVKTAPTAVPVLSTSFNSNVVEQEQDILSAFLAFSGTELFQYTNQRSVDGMFDDVSIISVLSDRRNGYLPNDIIEIYPQFVKNIYRGTGLDSDKLFIELEGLATSGELLLQFFIGGTVVTTIGSAEYV